MYGNNSNGNGAAWARRFAAPWAVLAIGLGLAAFPAEAQPFAYVANGGSDTLSVIDTATHPPSVVATVGVGMSPDGVAVTPNGETCLCRERGFQHCFGDPRGHQHGRGVTDPGGG
jgi:YVTN family beta-propeller protein